MNEKDVEQLKEMLSVLIFLTMRNYDALSLMLPSDEAEKLSELHERGEFLNAAPWEME